MTRAGFKELFDSKFDAVRNYIFYRSGDAELATDIAQEAFMKLWEKQFSGDEKSLTRLLYKISADLFVSHYRRQKLEITFKKRHITMSNEGLPDKQFQTEELLKQFQDTLNELPDKQRVVFLMSRIDGKTYPEISEHLGIGIKAVEKRMSMALRAFRSKIDWA